MDNSFNFWSGMTATGYTKGTIEESISKVVYKSCPELGYSMVVSRSGYKVIKELEEASDE